MRRFIAALFAFALLSSTAQASPPVFNGNIVSSGMPTFNVLAFGAKGDGTTDDTAAFNAAISAATTVTGGKCGGEVYVPRPASKYLILGALTVPTTTGSVGPIQCPVRITGDGNTFNGYWASAPLNGGSVLDMQYTGGDGLHPAKIDTRGAGTLEIDHLTIEDTASDNFLFIQTTNTTLFDHDNAFIGNPVCTGANCTQDVLRLGADGYSTTGNISSGTNTLTIASSLFTSGMVGWNISVGGSGNYTIASYISPTQVTLSSNSGTTVSGATVNFFGTKTTDPQAPFQGYGTVIARNYYSHIQRGVIWGTYANNITVEDETYANNCGSNLTYGAPYYFDSTTDVQDGNVIRGGTVEVTGYPYLVSLNGFEHGNTFSGIGTYDHNGHTVGVYYFANGNASNNTVIEGQVDSALNPVLLAGSGASLNTVITQGIGNVGSQFMYAVNSTGTAGRGHGFQIDGHDTLYSDTGASDVNLWLASPGNAGAINFVTGNGTGAVANARVWQVAGLNAMSSDGGTGLILQSQGSGGTIKLYDSASTPAPVVMGALQATSFSTTGTVNTLNGWQFNPNASTDFYLGSSGTTAANIHFRTNGYSNGDKAVIDWTGAYKPGSASYGPTSASVPGTGTFNSVQPNGSANGYAAETRPLGVKSTNPLWVSGTCAVTAPSTACTFPNSFAYTDATFLCTFSIEGATPQDAPTYDTKTTTGFTVHMTSSATVDYQCLR